MIEIFWTIWAFSLVLGIVLLAVGIHTDKGEIGVPGIITIVICVIVLALAGLMGSGGREIIKPTKLGKAVGVTIGYYGELRRIQTEKAIIFNMPDSLICIQRKYTNNMYGIEACNEYSFIKCGENDE